MLISEYYETICKKLGVDVEALVDRLRSTYLDAICTKLGIDVSKLPDHLRTTYLSAICQSMGIDLNGLQDKLISTYLEAILEKKGVDVDALPDRLLNTYLDAIIANIGSGESGGDNTGGEDPVDPPVDPPVEPDPDPDPDPVDPPTYEKYSWEGVKASVEAGTYATDYAIGDLIPLDLGSEGLINMQIAAFDADELADGSGMAHISFVAKELLATSDRMNPRTVKNADGTYQDKTGSVGGWPKCEMRTYLNDTIHPLIPSDVQAMIRAVTKYSVINNTAGAKVNNITSTDSVWLPSSYEIRGGTAYETNGPSYTALFSSNDARIKCNVGSSSASIWWLRSAQGNNEDNFDCEWSTGEDASGYSHQSMGIALGFCV